MNRATTLLAAACAALIAGAAGAAPIATPAAAAATVEEQFAPIGFATALTRVLQRNPDLRQADLSIQVAAQDLRRARSPFLPRLDLSTTTQRIEAFGSLPGLETLLLGGKQSAYHTTSSLTLALNVINGGADLAGLRLADEKRSEAQLQYQLRRVSLASSVLENVHTVRLAELDMRIANLHAAAKEEVLAAVDADFREGRRPALAVSEARYDADNSALEQEMRRRTYRNARRELLALMGDTAEAAVADNAAVRTGPGSGAGAARSYRRTLDDFGFAPGQFSQSAVYGSRVEQARFEVKRARSHYLPRLDIFASLNYAGLSQSSIGHTIHTQQKDKKFIGFTLSWNLFNGFDTDAETKGASLRVIAAQAAYEGAQDEQRKRAAELLAPMDDALDDERLQRKKLRLMESKLEMSRVKLELGKTDAGSHRGTEVELRLQHLELEKRAELVEYYSAMLMLRQASDAKP